MTATTPTAKDVAAAHQAARPAHLNPADIPRELERLFPLDTIRRLARETTLIQRERKIDPVALLWVIVLGFGAGLQRTLADLRRSYATRTGTDLEESSWYDRFTPSLVRFLKACVVHALQQTAGDASRQLGDKLQRFQDLLVVDNTVIRLHAALARKWPATRSRVVAAGIKVSLLISAVANGPKSVAIHSERTPEIKTLRIGPWIKDRILLMDLGFYKFQMFARITQYGGSFVSRLKENGDPQLVRSLKVHRGRALDLEGKRWSQVKDRLQREVLDAEVEVAFRRRRYSGKRSSDTLALRLVAVYDEKAQDYHVYLTNIPPEVLSAEDVAALYSCRWEVELVFKELKSRYALDVIKTKNPTIVLGLVWTAILTLVVSRRLYNRLLASAPRELVGRYTPLRWATTFAENGKDLLHALLGHWGFEGKVEGGFEKLAWLYESHSLDPHVKRHRLRQEWYA